MNVFEFRPSRHRRHGLAHSELVDDYVEFDELLASGAEVALEEDAGGRLVLSEDAEFE